MRRSARILLPLLALKALSAQAQDPSFIDSLERIVARGATDKKTSNALYELALENLGRAPDQALLYAQRALVMSRAATYPIGEVQALSAWASALQDMGDMSGALNYYRLSQTRSGMIGDSVGVAQQEGNIGMVHAQLGDYPEALKHFIAALKMDQAVGRRDWEADAMANIGNVHKEQHEHELALEYLRASQRLCGELGDRGGVARAHNNIAGVLESQRDLPAAKAHLDSALSIQLELGYTFDALGTRANLSMLKLELGQQEEALRESEAVIRDAAAAGDPFDQGYAALVAGRVYKALHRFPEALERIDQALALGSEIGSDYLLSEGYRTRSVVDSARGDLVAAYHSYKKYRQANDSLYSHERTRSITQQQMRFDFDKKEALMQAEQDKRNALAAAEIRRKDLQRNASIVGFGLTLLLAVVFFTQRNRINKEKKRSEELLLNILPAEVADELKANGEAEARHFDSATILFTDFKGFTEASEKMSARALVEELNVCFKAFDGIITARGIEKIKTIGDSYMCASGVPTPDPEHAVKSVLAAVEVRGLMERWRKERTAKGKQPWALRIGLHSGPVVAGVVGKRKFAYDIWGDAVNTASRMESSGEPGQVNVSGTTYELVKGIFECEHRGAVEAKNKGHIDMYFVRGIKAEFSEGGKGLVPSKSLLKRLGVASATQQFA